MFHKDEAHRGEHLIDPANGEVWPWTETLAKKNWALADDKKAFMERHSKAKLNVMKLHEEVPEPEPPIHVPENATKEEAIEIYKSEYVQETKSKVRK